MPGPQEVVPLGRALGKRPAYFLGVDDVEIPISPVEEALVKNWRGLGAAAVARGLFATESGIRPQRRSDG
jgi:hypothetical protein